MVGVGVGWDEVGGGGGAGGGRRVGGREHALYAGAGGSSADEVRIARAELLEGEHARVSCVQDVRDTGYAMSDPPTLASPSPRQVWTKYTLRPTEGLRDGLCTTYI